MQSNSPPTTAKNKNPFAPPSGLFLTVPLYEVFPLAEDSRALMRHLYAGEFAFDAPCIQCGRESHFKSVANNSYPPLRLQAPPPGMPRPAPEPDWLADFVFARSFHCARIANHSMSFLFHMGRGALQKVGQIPSLADLSTPELRKHKKVLGEVRLGELTRAVGLAAHGVGIGSFVYLRRIFESLLEDHRKASEAESGDALEGYETMRMEDKIDALRGRLPPLLVSNKKIYAILSKGIHELDEDTCLAYFPVVQKGILLILQQEEEKRARDEAEKQLTDQVGKISGMLKQQ